LCVHKSKYIINNIRVRIACKDKCRLQLYDFIAIYFINKIYCLTYKGFTIIKKCTINPRQILEMDLGTFFNNLGDK